MDCLLRSLLPCVVPQQSLCAGENRSVAVAQVQSSSHTALQASVWWWGEATDTTGMDATPALIGCVWVQQQMQSVSQVSAEEGFVC